VLALSSLNDAQAYALALRRTLPQLLGRAKFGPTTPWPGTSWAWRHWESTTPSVAVIRGRTLSARARPSELPRNIFPGQAERAFSALRNLPPTGRATWTRHRGA